MGEFGDGLVVRVTGKEANDEFILNHFGSSGLFDERKMLILTNPEDSLELDKLPDREVELVLVFDKELGVKSKILSSQKIKMGRVYNFATPQDKRIWNFLDLVLENNPRMIKLCSELVEEYGGQYLLTMLVFNLRRVLIICVPCVRVRVFHDVNCWLILFDVVV